MKKSEIIAKILGQRLFSAPANSLGRAFAPSNIALCKYWGKRDSELNLPVTSSLSISLGNKGSECSIQVREEPVDHFTLNGTVMDLASTFSRRLSTYLDLFRQPKQSFAVAMQMNIPIAAGLASSACGFASLVLALDKLFGWNLSNRELSILARLGSGSACRSIIPGFVEWQAGQQADGMDSYADLFADKWPGLCLGLFILNAQAKPLSSREAMEQTRASSIFYPNWPDKVATDLLLIKQAITERNFPLLGSTAESNALSMHALMLSAWPPISYTLPETLSAMHKIWQLRREGVEVYFTQDAGPNLKLLYLEKERDVILQHFPRLDELRQDLQD